jgi:hypothetical protein
MLVEKRCLSFERKCCVSKLVKTFKEGAKTLAGDVQKLSVESERDDHGVRMRSTKRQYN